ncbi:sugar transferase, partial [Singulisphaera rosea]
MSTDASDIRQPFIPSRELSSFRHGASTIGRGWRGSDAAVADRKTAQRLAKRIFDYAAAAVSLMLISPVFVLLMVLIRLDSRGPIFFRQQRLGLGGRPFWVLKFRTMVTDAEARLAELEAKNESNGGVLFKMKRDPRVTRLGRILRRTSLDELPQLINVLKGEMSLVGPRPLQLRDCALLEEFDSEGFAQRLKVLPG